MALDTAVGRDVPSCGGSEPTWLDLSADLYPSPCGIVHVDYTTFDQPGAGTRVIDPMP